MKITTSIFLLLLGSFVSYGQTRQQFAALGNFKLESGQSIQQCRIGYRTSGRLNASKSNAIVLLTWYGGTSAAVEGGNPWQLVDTTRYYLITIDALGNGVSSSPSNSTVQHGSKFPEFCIKDMVNSQYLLLTKNMGIKHAKAILGISMAGMQAFEWSVSYPDFADNIIPIVGSPQASSYDLMFYNTFRRIIEENKDFDNGNYKINPNIVTANMLFELVLTTPTQRVQSISHSDFPKWMANVVNNNSMDWNDRLYQIKAIIYNDVAKPYQGSLAEAAARVKARMLIFPSKQDMTVNPGPAIAFAKLLNVQPFIIDSENGHMAGGFGDKQVKEQVTKLLAN